MITYGQQQTNNRFTKHFDIQSGKYYYYDTVTGTTTWDKPIGFIKLEEPAIVPLAISNSTSTSGPNWKEGERELVRKQMIAEREKVRGEQLIAAAGFEAKRIDEIWTQAFSQAKLCGGDFIVSWVDVGRAINPSLYNFHETYHLQLKSVRLIGIGLQSLDVKLCTELRNLEVLSLSNNELVSLPDELTYMTSLRELNVMRNKLESLPYRIGYLCSLQTILLANNVLRELPYSFAALNLLQRVDLECNRLKVLPENLDNLLCCHTLNLNNNRLIRLPRCLSKMPSLTSLSAIRNQISYLPHEMQGCESLKTLRLSNNQIRVLPDWMGSLSNLKELSLDFNNLNLIPLTFHKLSKLRILRVEGNPNLCDPPPEVLARGAIEVVEYINKKLREDESYQTRLIIANMQDALYQVRERGLADQALFEPFTKLSDSQDEWYALQLSYFWEELLPELKSIWHHEGQEGLANASRFRFQSFPYDEGEVIRAFMSYSDAYGNLIRRDKAMFRRCACVDEKTGKRKPCVPPQVGYMCQRTCTLIKSRSVMSYEKTDRLWREYRRNGIADAIKRAEGEAKAYLDSKEGKLWLELTAYEQANDLLIEQGADQALQWRQHSAERRKKRIVRNFDWKKRKIEKKRKKKISGLEESIAKFKDQEKTCKDGYLKQTLVSRINELTKQIAELPETIELMRLQQDCEKACKEVDDDLFHDSTSESSEEEESSSEEEIDEEGTFEKKYITEEKRKEREEKKNDPLYIAKRQRRLRRLLEEHEAVKAQQAIEQAKVKSTLPDDFDVADLVSFAADKYIVQKLKSAIKPDPNPIRELQRKQRQKHRKRMFRQARDVAEIRMKKIFNKVNGKFDELQKELKHEITYQYFSQEVAQAKLKAEREFDIIEKTRHSLQGASLEKVFLAWKHFAKTAKHRVRKDLREEYRTALKKFEQAMESVVVATAYVEMWDQHMDVYTDQIFWKHKLNGSVSLSRPGIENYLPLSFTMPPPPKPLPEGVGYESTDEEAEEKERQRRHAEEQDEEGGNDGDIKDDGSHSRSTRAGRSRNRLGSSNSSLSHPISDDDEEDDRGKGRGEYDEGGSRSRSKSESVSLGGGGSVMGGGGGGGRHSIVRKVKEPITENKSNRIANKGVRKNTRIGGAGGGGGGLNLDSLFRKGLGQKSSTSQFNESTVEGDHGEGEGEGEEDEGDELPVPGGLGQLSLTDEGGGGEVYKGGHIANQHLNLSSSTTLLQSTDMTLPSQNMSSLQLINPQQQPLTTPSQPTCIPSASLTALRSWENNTHILNLDEPLTWQPNQQQPLPLPLPSPRVNSTLPSNPSHPSNSHLGNTSKTLTSSASAPPSFFYGPDSLRVGLPGKGTMPAYLELSKETLPQIKLDARTQTLERGIREAREWLSISKNNLQMSELVRPPPGGHHEEGSMDGQSVHSSLSRDRSMGSPGPGPGLSRRLTRNSSSSSSGSLGSIKGGRLALPSSVTSEEGVDWGSEIALPTICSTAIIDNRHGREAEEAMQRIQRRYRNPNPINPTSIEQNKHRNKTYMDQKFRRPKTATTMKEADENNNLTPKSGSGDSQVVIPKTDHELLHYVGGNSEVLELAQQNGEEAMKLRTVLAHRALHLREVAKTKLNGGKPVDRSFYQREVLPFFLDGDYDSEDEIDMKKRVEKEQRVKMKEERKQQLLLQEAMMLKQQGAFG